MNAIAVSRVLGVVWIALAGAMAIPGAVALLSGESALPFGIAIATALLCGAAPLLWSRRSLFGSMGHREAFLAVSSVWLSVGVLGAIPFATHDGLDLGPIDALFESVSGFTTTGATVLSGLDTLPRSVLLWRSITQWIGGMGMMIFGIAILPLLGVGGMSLFKAEAPGPTKDKMTPRIAETARLLWMLYVALTAIAAGVFWLHGMSAFDAINHAMTAISTGGFSTHDASLAHFESGLLPFFTTIVMLCGGTSFVVLHRALTGRLAWRDQPELRVYVGVFCFATALIAARLRFEGGASFEHGSTALEHAAFQVASILTTTGYATMDFGAWPSLCQAVLLGLFFVGGMAGSTAGGPKVIRIILLWRALGLHMARLAHPRSVQVLQVGPHKVSPGVVSSSLGFLGLWFALLGVGTLALSAGGVDFFSSFSAAASCLGNVGPGFGAVGPSNTFAFFDSASKLVMAALMILGRLEIYTLLIVLTPGFWRF